MSFLPDLTPLINQIKEFNQNQIRTNQLLENQNQLAQQRNLLLQEIKQILIQK